MKIHPLHRWDLTPKEAIALQRDLAGQAIVRPACNLDRAIKIGNRLDGRRVQRYDHLFDAVLVHKAEALAVKIQQARA